MTKYQAEVTVSFVIEFEDDGELSITSQAYEAANEIAFDIPNIEEVEVGRIVAIEE